MDIDKLDLQSPDFVNENFEKLAALFPNCVTESADGKAIDFDLLKQELNHAVVEGNKERYRLEWPGKREAIVTANLPTSKTLRPVREDSVDFDNTENIYIEGDNLEVLKLLQESYLGKIKMIYIDPPYNTGKDFVYKDNFTQDSEDFKFESGQKDEYNQRLFLNPETAGRYHSDWLTMMYPRLKLARNLLADDGVLMVSIDNNEVDNARKICGEIFGEFNYVESLVWKKKYGGGAKTRYYVGLHEYILVYAKNKSSIENISIPYKQETIDRYYKYRDDKMTIRGPYRLQPLATNSNDLRPNLRYPLIYDGKEVWPEKQWQWSKERTEKAQKNDELVFVDRDGKVSVNFKQYLKDEEGEIRESKPVSIIEGTYTQHGTAEIKEIFGDGQIFSFPKPSNLITEIGKAYLNDGDIFLDFFSGSSSSAQAILKLNVEFDGIRKYIQVQIPELTEETSEAFKAGYKNLCDIGKERIRRISKTIIDNQVSILNEKKDELKKITNGKLSMEGDEFVENLQAEIDNLQFKIDHLDLGFRVYRLDESNMQDVYYKPQDYKQSALDLFADNVKPDRTADDLLAQVMLDWGLPLSLKIEQVTITGKKVFKVAANSLYACFDTGIDENFAKEIAKDLPLRVVFRDNGFKDDTAKTNVKQLLKQLSPETEMKVI
jgi:adenine-specific DNA-methyltransferase